MSTTHEFEEFVDALRERCHEVRRNAPALIRDAGRELSSGAAEKLYRAAVAFDATLDDLDAAAQELHEQHEALFAARLEMEAQGQFYRELFDLAPAACLVTTPDAKITHANLAATYLFGCPLNALVGRLMVGFVALPERGAFRAALARALEAPCIEDFPLRFTFRGAAGVECRVRVSARREHGLVQSLQWMITEDGSADDDLL